MNKTNSNKQLEKIAISIGDPSGIGIEVTLKALFFFKDNDDFEIILVGCKKCLQETYYRLRLKGINNIANPENYEIVDIPLKEILVPGKPNINTGESSFNWLTTATNLVLESKAKALVTAPIAKFSWHQAGYFYPGQTERLAEITKSNDVSMLFTAISPNTGWRFNTMLATTHIPICEIPERLNEKLIIKKIDALLAFCKKFKPNPKLAIAGLNPHSGEKGNLGKEEIEYIIPAIERWKSTNPFVELVGPIPPDTCWISACQAWQKKTINQYDGFLALYHDQGLIPIKLIAFDLAVNTTFGLPFIRTSPDHGTGFDIADLGIARPESMIEAIKAAWDLSNENSKTV